MSQDLRDRNQSGARALRLTLIFLALGVGWVLVTDFVVEWLVAERIPHTVAQITKGLLYVCITSALVYWLSRRAFAFVANGAAESQARLTEQLLQTVMSNLGEPVLIIEASTRSILRCNAAVETVFGYTPTELVGQTTEVLYRDRAAFEAFAQRGEPELERRGVFRCEQPLKHKDGSILQTEITVVALRSDLGWRAGIASIVRDVTARKEAEAALKESESRYRLLAEHTLDIIWAMTPDLVFTYVNPAIETVTGHTQEEFVGTHLRDHVDAAKLTVLEQVIRDECDTGPHEDGVVVEIEMLTKDGSQVPVEVHGRVIFGDNEEPTAIQGTTRDISHRRALEAELRQSQKLQALGTFAGGVAHEIANPIMGISGYAEIIADAAESDPKMQECCAEIQKEAGRIHTLIKDLLGYARTDEKLPPEPASLQNIVESTLSLVRTVIRHDHIEMDVNVPEDLPNIRCRRQQIQQVVMNLVTNSRDALNSRYPRSSENKRLVISGRTVDTSGGQRVRLTVEDNGTGIVDEVRQRMFDPFFTTKPGGEGTGLGMWIVYRIVQEHGGDIQVETTPGEFSRFNIDLPVA